MSSLANQDTDVSVRFERDVLPLIPQLHRAALGMTRDRLDAEDLVQDTLARAYVAFHQFTPDTNLGAWLYRVQATTFLNTCRKRRREPLQSLHGDFDELHVPVDRLSQPIRSAEAEALGRAPDSDVMQALRGLPAGFGAAIYLADVEGYPYREVAEILGVPIGTVMSRLHRGRQKLRERLASHQCRPAVGREACLRLASLRGGDPGEPARRFSRPGTLSVRPARDLVRAGYSRAARAGPVPPRWPAPVPAGSCPARLPRR
jgi:RNA polymerase sigma-70 factor (ECF subfamily)